MGCTCCMVCIFDWVVMVVVVCMLLVGLDSINSIVCSCMGVVVDSISLGDIFLLLYQQCLLLHLFLLGKQSFLLSLLFLLGQQCLLLGLLLLVGNKSFLLGLLSGLVLLLCNQ